MSENLETAKLFTDACDNGKGWEVCSQYCNPDATFTVQAGALADIATLEGYVEWAKGLLTPMPDARYELRFCAEDEARGSVAVYSVFHGTHTGEGGPIEPSGKAVATDYVYVMQFEDGRIRSLNKIWNDSFALQQLGWA